LHWNLKFNINLILQYFILYILFYFFTLKLKDKLENEIFGVKDLKNVHMLIEIIICWGLYPSLMKGVGISLGKRVNSNILKNQGKIIYYFNNY